MPPLRRHQWARRPFSMVCLALSTSKIGLDLTINLPPLNFANIALYVKAHLLLKDSPAVVFAGMNIMVVLLGVFSGLLFFKEKLKLATAIGLVLGITSVACLAYAMSV